MLFKAMYYRISDVEMEFRSTLEDLLQQEIPHFDWLVAHEKGLPYKHAFYLFFTKGHNRPVGFHQFHLKEHSPSLGPWEKMKTLFQRPDPPLKVLCSEGAGPAKWGTVFHPHFFKEGMRELEKIRRENQELHRPTFEKYCHSGHFLSGPSCLDIAVESERGLEYVKNYQSYDAYLQALAPEIRKKVTRDWKALDELSIAVAEYPDLEQALTQHPQLAQEMGLSPGHLEYFTHRKVDLLSFEDEQGAHGLVILEKGKRGNVFASLLLNGLLGEPKIPLHLYYQYALLKFFEMEGANKIRFFPFPTQRPWESQLAEMGLSVLGNASHFYSTLSKWPKSWEQYLINDEPYPIYEGKSSFKRY